MKSGMTKSQSDTKVQRLCEIGSYAGIIQNSETEL